MKTKVLIIEDDPHILLGLEEVLRSDAFEVAICARGDQALEAVMKHQPAGHVLSGSGAVATANHQSRHSLGVVAVDEPSRAPHRSGPPTAKPQQHQHGRREPPQPAENHQS